MAEYIDVDKLQKDFEEVCVGECDCCKEESCPVYTQSTVKAIPIPEGATNGDMIKAMFSNISINETNRGFVLLESENDNVSIWNSWWNAPYKPESEGNND